MDNELIKLYARLNFHQLLILVVQANEIGRNHLPELALENYREDIMRLLSQNGSDDAASAAVLEEMKVFAEKYLDDLEMQVDHVLRSA